MGDNITNPELNVHCSTEELIKTAQAFNLEIEDLAVRYGGSDLAILEREGYLPGALAGLSILSRQIENQINYLQTLP